MADVRFTDGTVRTLLLIQRVWVNDISSLLPQPPKPRLAQIKPEPDMCEEMQAVDMVA